MPPLLTRFGGGAKVDGSRSDEMGVGSRLVCSGVPRRPRTAPCVEESGRPAYYARGKRGRCVTYHLVP